MGQTIEQLATLCLLYTRVPSVGQSRLPCSASPCLSVRKSRQAVVDMDYSQYEYMVRKNTNERVAQKPWLRFLNPKPILFSSQRGS